MREFLSEWGQQIKYGQMKRHFTMMKTIPEEKIINIKHGTDIVDRQKEKQRSFEWTRMKKECLN